MNFRVGLGYDVHPFAGAASGRRLVLGGVTIEDCEGLAGHSDADAVAHSVADALLGPSGLDDLGTMFPASDDRYRDANSMALLDVVVAKVWARGWGVSNVDIVITAERPRLGPYVSEIRERISAALLPLAVHFEGDVESPTNNTVFVSITAKRGEGIGAIGRGEGIEVRAVALLARRPR